MSCGSTIMEMSLGSIDRIEYKVKNNQIFLEILVNLN